DPPGNVNVKSNELGTKRPRPDAKVRNAGLHVVASELFVFTTNVPVRPAPQSIVPPNERGALDGAAETGAAPSPNAARANVPETTDPLTAIRRRRSNRASCVLAIACPPHRSQFPMRVTPHHPGTHLSTSCHERFQAFVAAVLLAALSRTGWGYAVDDGKDTR